MISKFFKAFGLTTALALAVQAGSNQPIMAQMSRSAMERKQPAVGWWAAGSAPQNYDMGVDHTVIYNGQPSGFIKSNKAESKDFGTLMQVFLATDYQGKRVRLSGYVKSKEVEKYAGLWMRVDGQHSSDVELR